MPIYEYQCDKCGYTMEVLQKASDPGPSECAQCGAKKKVRRVMSSTAFHFKGSGWYITDYSRKDQERKAKSKKKADGGGDAGASDKGDKTSPKSDAALH